MRQKAAETSLARDIECEMCTSQRSMSTYSIIHKLSGKQMMTSRRSAQSTPPSETTPSTQRFTSPLGRLGYVASLSTRVLTVFLCHFGKCMLRFSAVRDDIDSLDMPRSPQHFDILTASRRLKRKLQNDHTTSGRQTLAVACSKCTRLKIERTRQERNRLAECAN